VEKIRIMNPPAIRLFNTLKVNNKNNFNGSDDSYSREPRQLQAQSRDRDIYLDQREIDKFAKPLLDNRGDYKELGASMPYYPVMFKGHKKAAEILKAKSAKNISFGGLNPEIKTLCQIREILWRGNFDDKDETELNDLLNDYMMSVETAESSRAKVCVLADLLYIYWKLVQAYEKDINRENIVLKVMNAMIEKGVDLNEAEALFAYNNYDYDLVEPWIQNPTAYPRAIYPHQIKNFLSNSYEILNKKKNEKERLEKEKERLKTQNQFETVILKRMDKQVDWLSEQYDIYDISNWDAILDELAKFDKDSCNYEVAFAIENLPDIFLTKDNETEYKKILNRLSKIDGYWNLKDKSTGMTLAHRAAISENPLLIKFANEKEISFSENDNSGKTAFDYLKEYNTTEVNAALKGYKINYPELGEFAQKGMASVLKFALNYPCVDVNTVDVDKNNLGIIAAKNGNTNIIKLLNGYDDFDINYRNPDTRKTALDVAENPETLVEILKNPKVNPNESDDNRPPLIFRFLSNDYGYDLMNKSSQRKIFITLLENPKIDHSVTYKNKTLAQVLKEYLQKITKEISEKSYSSQDLRFKKELIDLINNALLVENLNIAKSIVNKNGTLTLEQIQDFLQVPGIKTIINTPLNDDNETIGFFVADSSVNLGNIKQFEKIMELLFKNNYDFSVKNKMGQTFYSKAVDAEIAVIIDDIDNRLDKMEKI